MTGHLINHLGIFPFWETAQFQNLQTKNEETIKVCVYQIMGLKKIET